jgi:hypothetical protein
MSNLSEQSENCPQKSEVNESESLINRTLDVFLFGPLLTVIPKKYITRQFISGFLLTAFLIGLYSSNDSLLRLDFSVHMLALYAILGLTIAELIRKNYPVLNSWFSSDAKSQNFFNNIGSMTDDEMHQFIKFHIFSSICINKMILIVKGDVNRIPSDILEYALTTQDLTKENLDLLLSTGFVLDEKIILHVLFQKNNQLTEKNIFDLYENYRDNQEIIKFLFATQKGSKKLLEKNNELSSFIIKYQKEKKFMDSWLRKISPNWFFLSNRKKEALDLALIFSTISSPIIDWLIVTNATICLPSSCPYLENFFSIIIPIWFIIFLSSLIAALNLIKYVSKRYFDHFCWKVESS